MTFIWVYMSCILNASSVNADPSYNWQTFYITVHLWYNVLVGRQTLNECVKTKCVKMMRWNKLRISKADCIMVLCAFLIGWSDFMVKVVYDGDEWWPFQWDWSITKIMWVSGIQCLYLNAVMWQQTKMQKSDHMQFFYFEWSYDQLPVLRL